MAQHVHTPGPALPHLRAVMTCAQLGQDMAGDRIVVEPAGMDIFQPQRLEGISDQPVRGFGGIAKAPEGLAQPIAEFIALIGMQPGHAQEHAVALALDHEAVFGRVRDKGFRVAFMIGMRHARRHARHVIIAQPNRHALDIRWPGRPQDQSLALQGAHVIPRSFLSGAGNKKGRWRTISLARNGPPISWRPMSSAAYSAAIFIAGFAPVITDTKVRRL